VCYHSSLRDDPVSLVLTMKDLRLWQTVVVVSQLGFVLAAGVAIGLFAGWYLDSLAHMSPFFTILGALVGMAAGLYSCARIARDFLESGRS